MDNIVITNKLLREVFTLDAERGVLIWKYRDPKTFKTPQAAGAFNKPFAGKVAGSRWPHSRTFRVRITLFRQQLFAHRIIYALYNDIEFLDVPETIDHKDGNGENNRPENLRAATRQQNSWNIGPRDGTFSGVKGVKPSSGSRRWQAVIRVDGKQKNLGSFKEIEDAAAAYRAAALDLHGEFARF